MVDVCMSEDCMSVTPLLFAAVVLKWDSDVFLTLGSNYRHLNLYIYLSINEIEKSFSFSFCCVQHLHDRNYVGLSLVLTFPLSLLIMFTFPYSFVS